MGYSYKLLINGRFWGFLTHWSDHLWSIHFLARRQGMEPRAFFGKQRFFVAKNLEGNDPSSAPLRLHGMSWGVKTTCFKAPGVSLGGFGVSIGGVRILRADWNHQVPCHLKTARSSSWFFFTNAYPKISAFFSAGLMHFEKGLSFLVSTWRIIPVIK